MRIPIRKHWNEKTLQGLCELQANEFVDEARRGLGNSTNELEATDSLFLKTAAWHREILFNDGFEKIGTLYQEWIKGNEASVNEVES